ncbi:MAG TPA: two-component regulator propeller domain-containing protein [Candidatus Acidoferrales bacterium]|nr:two-component regulator propeller domain-containing protein [Candidatus Acidoferrales bacterium]
MKQKFYIRLFLCFACLGLPVLRTSGANSDLAERAAAMHVWRAADGLPSDSVTAILQTRDGFIWVGTEAGLARFDGVKFTAIKLDASTDNPVHVTALCEDSNGYLWIGTQQNGLFEMASGNIRHFTKEQKLVDDGVTSLAADDQGLVWVGSKAGLDLWDGKAFEPFTAREGLPDAYVTSVNVARSGTVWITTHVGMSRFINGRIVPYAFQTESQGRRPEYLGAYEDRRGNLWAFGDTYLINLAEGKRFNYFRSSESASVRIWSLCEGWDGRLWIGTSGRGLFCFEDNRFQPVILDKDRWPYDVRAICEDNEANLWLGTSGGGLIQLRPQSVYALRAEQGLPDGVVTAMASDANGRVYIGMERGGLFVGESGRFDAVENSDTLGVQNYVSSVCVTRDGTVWAGTLGSGLYGLRNGHEIHLTTADGLASGDVLAVCSDANGGIWFSAGSGFVYNFNGNSLARFGTANGLPESQVTVMIPSTSGGLWLGTRDGQILREEQGKFTNLEAAGIGHNPVLSLYEGEQGQLWIGTAGDGLICLPGGFGMNWTRVNGIPSDVVSGVVEDDEKNLWLATGEGIYRVNHSDVHKSLVNAGIPLACELMSKSKTMPDTPASSGGGRTVLSPNGELWFATSEGVLNVDPHNSGIGPRAFPVYLENAVFNGQAPISLLKGAIWSWPASNNAPFKAPVHLQSLEIHYTAPAFSAPEEIRFRYKLEGNDADWADDAGNHYARYGHLPFGHYRFRVQARSADGEWIEAAEPFAFVVPTPLYFQTWVLYIYGLTAVALIAGIVRMVSHRRLRVTLARLEQQQSLERERMRIARDMHDEIGSKLTKISFLSERVQVDEKNGEPLTQKIDSIAETSRELLKTMDEIVWVVNPRNDTLENLTTYLTHYAVEYFQNTAIECEMRLPREVPHYPLSSETRHNLFLAFEEALNNVLKHSGATKVKVEMVVSAGEFELKIADDGKGFDVPGVSGGNGSVRGSGGGNGLKNMRQRLAGVGGDCAITSQSGKGTVIEMHIPLNTEKTA